MDPVIDTYNRHARQYDRWFDAYPSLFRSELAAVRQMMPAGKQFGLEIGVGTGRFARELGIDRGLEPSPEMARMAEKRGIPTTIGMAEEIPFPDNHFDYAAMITVDCFLKDIPQALREIRRVLVPGGTLIVGMIDKNSEIGRYYEKIKDQNPFYRLARFHSPEEISRQMKREGFGGFTFCQTLFHLNTDVEELPQPGADMGGFVVIRASVANQPSV